MRGIGTLDLLFFVDEDVDLSVGAARAVPYRRSCSTRVRREIPDARLTIAGRNPEVRPGSDSPPPGIEFSGFVEDLNSLCAGMRVVCAPIFAGGGTRIKIVEAAAPGRPVVATSLGAEGLELRDGREILPRDDPERIVERIRTVVASCYAKTLSR